MVVASLVRSNNAGSIGFLGEPERINVLLSRARHGLLLIGNAQTLRSARAPAAKRQWTTVLDRLESSGALRSGLPARCQMHGHVHTPELDSPERSRDSLRTGLRPAMQRQAALRAPLCAELPRVRTRGTRRCCAGRRCTSSAAWGT